MDYELFDDVVSNDDDNTFEYNSRYNFECLLLHKNVINYCNCQRFI